MAGLFKPTTSLRFYRAGVLIAFVLLIHQQAGWLADQKVPEISLSQAGRFFPTARSLEVPDPSRGLYVVRDPLDEMIGGLMTTAPWTDHIIGYSGPNNLLIVLEPDGTIVRVELLESGDTQEFVDMVRNAAEFLPGLKGWQPNEQPTPRVEAVSGATLTSLAVIEGVQQRLLGAAPSLRFPDPVTIEEAREMFTDADGMEDDVSGSLRVLDASDALLGFVLRTSPQADNISGYQGPTECLVGLDVNRQTVTSFRLRKSYETPEYFEQVRAAGSVQRFMLNRSIEELAELEYPRVNLEGVSGATRTARSIVTGVQRRFAAELQEKNPDTWRPKRRDVAMLGVIVVGLVMALTSLRGRRWVSVAWQLFLVGYVGLVNHDLLSLSLFAGWTSHGLALKAAPGLVLLTAAALLVPWGIRRQFYCHQICPHGAAQQLLGKAVRRRRSVPAKVDRWLKMIPGVLLALAIGALLVGSGWDLAAIEPFEAWNWKTAGAATMTIAVVGLVAALFIPQAYCRYGCPTGVIFSFLRSPGSGDRWGKRDSLALGFLAAGVAAVLAVRAGPQPQHKLEPEPVLMTGHTMGTTWSVKMRDDLASPPELEKRIAKEFEWGESLTSHWRADTQISAFNRTHTLEPMEATWPVLMLSRWSAEISRETGGAFDITVGPLVRLWGFGPGAQQDRIPTDAELDAVRPMVGWDKLNVLDDDLQKQHPELEVDLSSIAKGWAINKVVDELVFQKYTDFLVEAGGELRAVGRWTIAIEHPRRTTTLLDESIASSGTYRQNYENGGERSTHLIDPRTGRPVTHQTVSVSVRHEDCARADAWATALNVLGMGEGMPIAERLSLAAQFVIEKPDGKLEVISSPAWKQREEAVGMQR